MSKKSKLTDQEWVELTRIAVHNFTESNHLRLGQSYMIALAKIRMDLYDEVTASDVDPFYVDSKLVKFIQYLNSEITLNK
jgi:hypothetical protein